MRSLSESSASSDTVPFACWMPSSRLVLDIFDRQRRRPRLESGEESANLCSGTSKRRALTSPSRGNSSKVADGRSITRDQGSAVRRVCAREKRGGDPSTRKPEMLTDGHCIRSCRRKNCRSRISALGEQRADRFGQLGESKFSLAAPDQANDTCGPAREIARNGPTIRKRVKVGKVVVAERGKFGSQRETASQFSGRVANPSSLDPSNLMKQEQDSASRCS